jgi:hypothetical protein
MRRLQRLPLSSRSLEFLRERSQAIAGAPDPRAEAGRLWNLQGNQAFREIRETLRRMASGLERCMYCEDGEGAAIEHFWPKAHYPNRTFDWRPDPTFARPAECLQVIERFPEIRGWV